MHIHTHTHEHAHTHTHTHTHAHTHSHTQTHTHTHTQASIHTHSHLHSWNEHTAAKTAVSPGDDREQRLLEHVLNTTAPGNASAVVQAIDDYAWYGYILKVLLKLAML